MQNGTQKNLLIFGNQQANRIVFIFRRWRMNEWKKKTNIGKPLKFHCFLRIHTQEHRAHLCICVLYSNIYRLHLFCLLSINVRIHKNEQTKKKKITITNFNDSFRQIFRTTKNKIENEVNSFVLFYFILLHNFFRIKTIFYFEWIVVFFSCVYLLFFLFLFLQTTRMISIQQSFESTTATYRLVQHSNYY